MNEKEKVALLIAALNQAQNRLKAIFEHPCANEVKGGQNIATLAFLGGADIKDCLKAVDKE